MLHSFYHFAVKWPAIVSPLMSSAVVQRFERFSLVGTAFSSDAYLTILKIYMIEYYRLDAN